ncbi:MAG TPA: sugar transferase [Solirubrobacteraceae bacterium]|jgi:exopolysaccharide biosynthesis polyprenyl glycosylphosphotransferase
MAPTRQALNPETRPHPPAPQAAPRAHPQPSTPASLRLPEYDVRRKRPPLLSFLLRMDTLRSGARVVSLLAVDFVGVFAAIFTALALKDAVLSHVNVEESLNQTLDIVAFAYLVTILLFARSDLYARRSARPGLTRIVASLFQVTAVALVFALVNGERFSSYYIFYGSLTFSVAYVAGLRFLYDRATGLILRAAGYQRRAILVGTGEHIEAVAHALDGEQSPINVVGFISLTPRPDNGLRSLGSLEDIGGVVERNRVDEVIIADPAFPEQQALELVDACHQRGVRVHVAPSTMEILIHRAEFVPGQSVPLFELKPPVFEGFDYVMKRGFDIVGASLLLLILSPALLAIAVAVKLSSRGPVLYRSTRPGIGGAPFACLKFRTMHTDAEQRQAELESLNEAGGAIFKIRDDPRLTRIGRLLRRFSMDELPQLVNVLRGEMSLVGPRPLPLRDFERLEPWHKKRYLVLPGITGLWQVSGRSDLDFDDLVRLDFLYLERWSPFLDLAILAKTIPAVISRKGAY